MTPAQKLLGVLALVVMLMAGAYHHGLSVKEADWQSAWNERDTRDAEARAADEATERTKEQAYQQSINKVIQDGQRTINQAADDVAAARASAASLRGAADAIATRLAASEASGNSCTAAASKAAARAALLLADVFKRADQRAGDLAEAADQARARGVTCERAYDALGV